MFKEGSLLYCTYVSWLNTLCKRTSYTLYYNYIITTRIFSRGLLFAYHVCTYAIVLSQCQACDIEYGISIACAYHLWTNPNLLSIVYLSSTRYVTLSCVHLCIWLLWSASFLLHSCKVTSALATSIELYPLACRYKEVVLPQCVCHCLIV